MTFARPPSRTGSRWALAVFIAMAVPACKKKPRQMEQQEVPAPRPPDDHLAPGEIEEGTEKAFALTLPRSSHVVGRYQSSVVVRSALSPELVANFVAARVKSGKRVVGTSTTVFDHVAVPSEPGRKLTIEIRLLGHFEDRTSILVQDVTPGVPAEIPADEAWRRAGRTPEGKIIDPSKVE